MATLISGKNQQSEAEPNIAPHTYDRKEEEVLAIQQQSNHERNSSLDQEEQDAAKAKKEELCISQSLKYPVNDKDFNNESQKKAHTVDEIHICYVCGNSFSDWEQLTLHLRKHIASKMLLQDSLLNARQRDSESPSESGSVDRAEAARHRESADVDLKSEMEPRREDFPEQHVCENEFSSDQQLWNQEENSGLEQEELEPPQVKEEQEELCISQGGEQLVVKLEADTFMVTLISDENQQSKAEPKSGQLLSHNSGSTKEEPKSKKRLLKTGSRHEDAPQLHDCKKEEVLTVQQLCNQERNFSLDQEEQDAAQVKEEEELFTSVEEKYFGLKQETDTFMVTPTGEDSDNNESEQNNEQLLSHNSPDTESQDQGAGKNVNPGSSKHEESKSKKRLHRNRSVHKNVDNSSMSENQCDTDTGEKSVKWSDNGKDYNNESQKNYPTVEKSHVCNTCGKRFSLSCSLAIHERVHTGEKFFCETCGHSFKYHGAFKAHIRVHTGEKPFSCGTCGKSFNQLGNLKTHMRIHTGEKPFSCETCGQSFNQRGYMKTHMRIHTGEKPFSCETCGQNFNHRGYLKTHMRIHTGEKPFSCETCGQSFNQRGYLKTHMRIHTGERPFSCETCGQSFNQRGYLKTHMRIHTGEKPFSCETCGHSFNQRGALKTHMRIHTGEKPFSCETCGQRFNHRGALKTHENSHR
ncbi:uncharacterized protein KZ484_011041 [Pholidichthys leucotaenia]